MTSQLNVESLPSTEPALSSVRAAYVHVPFCVHRCGYCDFTVIAGRDDLIPRYLAALRKEIFAALPEPQEITTLFLGGGTPSQLPADALDELLRLLTERLPLAAGGEFSVECNPDGLTPEKMDVLLQHGVNRISLGVQSFNPQHLRTLERQHTPHQVEEVVKQLRDRELANLSLDMIYAIPGQTLSDWKHSLDAAITLQPEHLSTYGLTFEKGTAFWTRRERKAFDLPPDDLEREMYAFAMDLPAAHGFQQYELSNHALPGFACRHNQVYWRGEEYFGFGPGAAAFLGSIRRMNHRSVTGWLKRVEAGESPVHSEEAITGELRVREALMLGLRQTVGVRREQFASRYGVDPAQLNPAAAARFQACGWLELSTDEMKLSREGRFVADTITAEFL